MAHSMPNRPVRTILLVDDHEMVLRALHTYLEKSGYNVLEAHDGEEALRLAERFAETIDVLVTDLIMVRMNGRDLAQQLTPLRPAMQVIMISGLPDEIKAQRKLTPEIPILKKPFLPQRLLMEIESALMNPRSSGTVARLAQSA
jgi:two-component system cell cycle sensor histidine kinase/response regulator CckA